MKTKTVNIVGISVGLAWFVTALYFGYGLFMQLLAEYGDAFAAFSLFYVLGWVFTVFLGRSILERLLVSLLKLDVDGEITWIEAAESPDMIDDVSLVPFGAVAACTIFIAGFNVDAVIEYDRDNDFSDTTAKVIWVTD